MSSPELRFLWDFNDPASSEARFDDRLTQDLSRQVRAETLTQKARALGLQRNFERARTVLDEASDLLDEHPTRADVAYWLELGRIENSSGNKEAAKPHFLHALDLAEGLGEEFLAIDAAHMMAIVETGEASLDWNLRAIAMAEMATDPDARDWLGSLLNNTGWSLYALAGDGAENRHRYSDALAIFEKALAFRLDQVARGKGTVENVRIARYCVAKTKRALNRLDEALTEQQALADEIEAEGKEAGFQWEEIGECLLLLNRTDEARPYFAKAHDALSKNAWLVDSEKPRLERLAKLAAGG